MSQPVTRVADCCGRAANGHAAARFHSIQWRVRTGKAKPNRFVPHHAPLPEGGASTKFTAKDLCLWDVGLGSLVSP